MAGAEHACGLNVRPLSQVRYRTFDLRSIQEREARALQTNRVLKPQSPKRAEIRTSNVENILYS